MTAKEYLEDHWMKRQVWKRLLLPVHQDRLRRCAEAVSGGRTFIDVGCGLGHSTEIMRGFCPGEWTGLDFYEHAVTEAGKLFPDICFRTAIQGGEVFDGVVCSEVIEHVEDPDSLVRFLWEITGRRLVVTTPNRPVNDPGHLRLFTEGSLIDLFRTVPGASVSNVGRFFYVTAEREV